MKNLTVGQWLGIAIVVLGVFGTSTVQLTDLFGAHAAKLIISASSLLSAIVGGITAMLTGQGAQIQAVVNMAKDPDSPVQGIITTNNEEGKALAKSIPGPIVTAGSATAIDIAKS